MFVPKTLDQAKDYIRQTTKRDVNDKTLVTKDYGGKIKVDKRKSTHIDHKHTANGMIKLINITPGLHPLSRKIMTMRIYNPGITDFEVAINCALRFDELRAYEREGIIKCQAYIKKTTIQEAADKFNRDLSLTVTNEIKNLNVQGKNNQLITA